MSQITPRTDNFYYIEVWDKQLLRDSKLNILFDIGEIIKPEFLGGSQVRLDRYKEIHQSLFWKHISTAEFRIECVTRNKSVKDKYDFVIKCLTREEFIKSIPDKTNDVYWGIGHYKRNYNWKLSEIEYLKKL
jgi:hypothetical protein